MTQVVKLSRVAIRAVERLTDRPAFVGTTRMWERERVRERGLKEAHGLPRRLDADQPEDDPEWTYFPRDNYYQPAIYANIAEDRVRHPYLERKAIVTPQEAWVPE